MSNQKQLTLCIAALTVAVLTAYSDRRPSETEAAQKFRALYPNVQLVDIAISEDEVIARSFIFRYGTTSGTVGEVEIQFMEGPTGEWIPQPKPPRVLPETAPSGTPSSEQPAAPTNWRQQAPGPATVFAVRLRCLWAARR
jgi:hypothetical protein